MEERGQKEPQNNHKIIVKDQRAATKNNKQP